MLKTSEPDYLVFPLFHLQAWPLGTSVIVESRTYPKTL